MDPRPQHVHQSIAVELGDKRVFQVHRGVDDAPERGHGLGDVGEHASQLIAVADVGGGDPHLGTEGPQGVDSLLGSRANGCRAGP